MNFHQLLKLTEASRSTADSFRTTGEAMAKDRETGKATTDKAKDAARKRAERAKQVPRERKSKAELIKEIIAVKTKSGRVQLIFKDSFNSSIHTKLNKDTSISEGEAKQFTSDPNFEQTRASKLLFGNLKEKEKAPEKEKRGEEKGKEPKEVKTRAPEDKKEPAEEEPKARKLSKEEIMKAMMEMEPEQLASMPENIKQEFFEKLRNPLTAKEFDSLTFENLTNKFGINTLSGTSYNQQVLNALLFVAKIKAGASDQELQALMASAPGSLDFTKSAFLQANKILSQIGDDCIKNLLSSIESGARSMYSEGTPELECGDYRFKISPGGEFAISTDSLNQSGKIIKGLMGRALISSFSNPDLIKNDPAIKKFLTDIESNKNNFAKELLTDTAIEAILSNEAYLNKFKSFSVISPDGKNLGTAIDNNGNVNPAISLSAYQNSIKKSGKDLTKKNTNNSFLKVFAQNVLKTSLRGDGITDPKIAPNHVITANGVFSLSDEYFNEISKTAEITIKKSEQLVNTNNIGTYKKSAIQNLNQWRTIVEEKENKKTSFFVNQEEIDPLKIFIDSFLNDNSIDINFSLLPGLKPDDINAIEYNYVKIDGKIIKIPVNNKESANSKLLGENYLVVNEMIYEALTNNFLLHQLQKYNVLDTHEVLTLNQYGKLLLEKEDLLNGCLIPIMNNLYNKVNTNLDYLIPIFEEILVNLNEEAKRNYKKEYKNYHGKPKQRKERAARTKARELMIKKGVVKKGDGIDIDHKKPLRSGGSNGINNLRRRKKSHNRSDNGHQKGEKQNKDWK